MKDIYSLIMYENATLPEKKFNKQTGKETCVPLLAPSGALVVIMVYYKPLFQIFQILQILK